MEIAKSRTQLPAVSIAITTIVIFGSHSPLSATQGSMYVFAMHTVLYYVHR